MARRSIVTLATSTFAEFSAATQEREPGQRRDERLAGALGAASLFFERV
jgi:hypothetical protein